MAGAAAGAEAVDVEIEALTAAGGQSLVQAVRDQGAQVLLSSHDFHEVPESLSALADFLYSFGPDGVKIAGTVNQWLDNGRLLSLAPTSQRPLPPPHTGTWKGTAEIRVPSSGFPPFFD